MGAISLNSHKFKYLHVLKLNMAVKTITITKAAYEALKAKKQPKESFSEVILRMAKRPSLWDFAGAISEETAKKMEQVIKENRQRHRLSHARRIKRIVAALEGRDDDS